MSDKTFNVRILYGENEKTLSGQEEQSLHEILSSDEQALLESPCGGKGKCGKCKCKILEGITSPVTDQEKKLLSDRDRENGVRLACLTRPESDLTIKVRVNTSVHIMAKGVDFDTEILPNIRKTHVKLDPPSLEDQRDDFARLKEQLGSGIFHMPLKELYKLPRILRENDYNVTAVHDRNYIITVEPNDTSKNNFGIAVDIGTTTVVAYLIDLSTGKQIDVASGLNKQKAHGQDVISRINFTLQHDDGIEQLRKRIINQINNMIWDLAERNNIAIENIYSITLAGNTTMLHLAAGLPPGNIASVPFIPVAKNRMTFLADDVGIGIPKGASVYMLPSISGYVGADIVAATLASGLFFGDAFSLLIDIGTNGEIVLGNRDGLLCCSTAAGPAFEGATIKHGIGGIAGAINTVSLDDHSIQFTTINDTHAIGICGSGIVDAVAMLLDAGIVDETGRMLSADEITTEVGKSLIPQLIEDNGQPGIVLVKGEQTENKQPIVLTQKDVREVQLAKASIAAGIQTLLKEAGKTSADIDIIYLAGGFGSFIDKTNAIRIGLMPAELLDRVKVIGNAAGTGAVLSLISENCLAECDRIAENAAYVELSSSIDFQNEYVDNMYFPDPKGTGT